MAKRRLWLLGVFVMLLAAAFSASRGDAQPGTVKQIAPGVWFREGDIKNLGHCNNIIIEMKDYLIVVDANFPSGARLVMEAARKLSAKPVKYVFDTHHHGDHAYGNPLWTEAGATTLAYRGVAEEMKRYEPQRWLQTAKERQDVAELRLPAPQPPQRTFSKSPFVLDDGTRQVRFYYFGWAHTRGDGFVYLPKEKVLCTGDAVANGPYNYLADGNIGNWPRVIRSAEELGAQHVLPGHGGPGGPEVLEGQSRFMTELYSAVQTQVRQGKKLEEVVRMEGGKPAGTSIQLSKAVQNWVAADGFPEQVKETYEEIAARKPHGDLPH